MVRDVSIAEYISPQKDSSIWHKSIFADGPKHVVEIMPHQEIIKSSISQTYKKPR